MIPLFALLVAAVPAVRQGPAPDEERSAWPYRRAIAVEGEAPLAVLSLPPEVATRCRPDLNDLRVLASDGQEVPYVLDRAVERETTPRWPGRLVDTRREARILSAWVVDLGERRAFDRLELDVRQQDFAKRLRVEASADRQTWASAGDDVGIFDRPWTARVHHTTVTFPQRVSARYLRITADDRGSRPVELLGAVALSTRRVAGESWRRPVPLRKLETTRGVSRYRLDLPSGFPLESLELDADDAVFSRRAMLRESRDVNGRRAETVRGEAQVYRLTLEDEALSGSALDLGVARPEGGELVLEVTDGDSPPLRNLRVVASAPATRLLFPSAGGASVLYYGNDATRAPLYDIDRLKERLRLETAFVTASLGDETANPRFRRSPPLAFVAARGAPLEVVRWRSVRRLLISGREDLYTVTLAPADLGRLRSDLADLRIVDEADRQVPYVVEAAASEAALGLVVERAGGRAPAQTSRYRLSLPAVGPRTGGLPLTSLELRFSEGFFSRPVRLLAPPSADTRGRERVLFAGTLARSPARISAFALEPAAQSPNEFLAVALDGRRTDGLVLEIQEGDNAPLTLVEARGVVRVPRVAFKAAPGPFRMLMGNEAAEAPRYDIASLRQEILAYSALPADAVASEPNPAFRRPAADYFQRAPPTVVLWATLLLSVVALLLLTARIVRSSPQ